VTILAGTSGFAFKEWKGRFYPADLPAKGMLRYYAERLPAVEINASFYRMPAPAVLRGWAAQVGPAFRFVIKAPRWISWAFGGGAVAKPVRGFARAAGALGEKLGAVLVQVPPTVEKDLGRLEKLLALLPAGMRAALDFRNASWDDADVRAALRARGATAVASDGDETAAEGPRLDADAPFGYVRLRRSTYDAAALSVWARRLGAQPWAETFVFFKHEDEARGPELAAKLQLLTASPAPRA